LEKERLLGVIEALIFSAEKPLREEDIRRVIPGMAPRDIREAIKDLRKIYDEGSGGIFIAEVAGGYQFRTRPDFARYIKDLLETKPKRISRAGMETLAIIAYRQPVLRTDIERIRGVDSGGVLRHLLERKLIKILGRKDVPGKPLLYGTTKEFLEVFGLKNLKSLPTLREMEALYEEPTIEQQEELQFTDDKDET
jgi:segregation and condensation protein B